ncbi:MAG: folate-binding protein, partial [Pseudomonadota bacterium]
EDILIDCEATVRDSLIKRLKIYRLRRKITIETDDILSVHWALDAGDKPHDPRLEALGHRWLETGGTGTEAGADAAWQAHRLSLGVTEGEAELGSEKTLWLECNAAELNGVSFEKGCYVGQENTARMNYRQKINRRIVVVPLDQADEKRQRKGLPELGLSVEHRRIDDLADLELPEWLQKAL